MNIFHQARISISTKILSVDGVSPRSPRLWTHQRKFSFSIHFSTIEIAAEKKKFSRKIPNWLWNHFLSSDWSVRKQLFNNLCKKFSFRSLFPFLFLHSFFFGLLHLVYFCLFQNWIVEIIVRTWSFRKSKRKSNLMWILYDCFLLLQYNQFHRVNVLFV